MNAKQLMKRTVTIGTVAAIAFADMMMPAIAMPATSSTTTLKTMVAPDLLQQVRYRRGYRGAVGAGVALGALESSGGRWRGQWLLWLWPGLLWQWRGLLWQWRGLLWQRP